MEFGPRALGNRSILVRPTDKKVNVWLNKKLKRTEFMPFAPITLEKESMSIRYPKDTSYNYDEDLAPEILEIGSWEKLKSGEKVAILATGNEIQK